MKHCFIEYEFSGLVINATQYTGNCLRLQYRKTQYSFFVNLTTYGKEMLIITIVRLNIRYKPASIPFLQLFSKSHRFRNFKGIGASRKQ